MEKKHFESLLHPLFFEGAHFRHIEKNTSELIYRVDWKMPTEGRPNRRSRPIEIYLSGDTLDDYRDAARQVDRKVMDDRIVKYVKGKLASFDPEHELSSIEQPQAVVWLITPDIASGGH